MDIASLSSVSPVVNIIQQLIHSAQVAKLTHWKISPKENLALHLALDEYYENISDVLDTLVESSQGFENKIYMLKVTECKAATNVRIYFEALQTLIDTNKTKVKGTHIINIIEEAEGILSKLLYKI